LTWTNLLEATFGEGVRDASSIGRPVRTSLVFRLPNGGVTDNRNNLPDQPPSDTCPLALDE